MSRINQSYYKNALARYNAKQFDDALKELKQIDDPDFYLANYLYGNICLKKKMVNDAKAKFIHCTKTHKDKLEAYLKLIEIYIQEKNFDAAKEYFDKLDNRKNKKFYLEKKDAEKEKENHDILIYKALYYREKKDYKEAIKINDEIINMKYKGRQDEVDKYTISKIGSYNKLGRFEESKEIVNKYTNSFMSLTDERKKAFIQEKMNYYIDTGNFEEALKLSQTPEMALAYAKGAVFYENSLYSALPLLYLEKYEEVLEKGKDIISTVEELEKNGGENSNEVKKNIENYLSYFSLDANDYKKTEKKKDTGFKLCFLIACAYRRKNDISNFKKYLEFYKMIGKYTTSDYYLEMAKYALSIGKYEECLQNISNSLKEKHNHIPTILFKIKYLKERGLVDEANKLSNDFKDILDKYQNKNHENNEPEPKPDEIDVPDIPLSINTGFEDFGNSYLNSTKEETNYPDSNEEFNDFSDVSEEDKKPKILSHGAFGEV